MISNKGLVDQRYCGHVEVFKMISAGPGCGDSWKPRLRFSKQAKVIRCSSCFVLSRMFWGAGFAAKLGGADAGDA